MTKKYRKRIVFVLCVLVLLVDRIWFMPDRLKVVWVFESGHYIKDPIAFKQDFEYEDFEIRFKTGEGFFLLGCYFGQMLLYDFQRKEVTRYSSL